MYIETSSPRTNGDSAELVTSTLSTSTPSCLSFKANMFGSTIGSLSVATIKGASRTVLYTKTGNQGQAWFDVKIDVPAATSFQVCLVHQKTVNVRKTTNLLYHYYQTL